MQLCLIQLWLQWAWLCITTPIYHHTWWCFGLAPPSFHCCGRCLFWRHPLGFMCYVQFYIDHMMYSKAFCSLWMIFDLIIFSTHGNTRFFDEMCYFSSCFAFCCVSIYVLLLGFEKRNTLLILYVNILKSTLIPIQVLGLSLSGNH